MNTRPFRAHAGFSMIEALVTIFVLAYGLMGVAALMVLSVRQQHQTRVQTQAVFVGEAMMERMRANPLGVWGLAYDGNYGPATGTSVPACPADTPCTPAQLATRDGRLWARELVEFLNDGNGQIDCVASSMPAGAELAGAPPFDGHCDVTVSWSEVSDRGDEAAPLEISWRFVP